MIYWFIKVVSTHYRPYNVNKVTKLPYFFGALKFNVIAFSRKGV